MDVISTGNLCLCGASMYVRQMCSYGGDIRYEYVWMDLIYCVLVVWLYVLD